MLASTTYFAISPVSTAHSELLARTSPTIYDVVIAFFGGMAGIVAISSKLKGNVIPGVAIATALMPPLCTAGYGLATGKFDFFFGAIYLFTINTVFIAISSVVVSQLLKFPIRTIADVTQRKRVNQWITAVIVITATPSIYFGYVLVQREHFNERAAKFVKSVSLFEGNYLLRSEVQPKKKEISLVYGGAALDSSQQVLIQRRAMDFDLDDASVEVKQGLSFDEFASELNEKEQYKSEINRLTMLLREKERQADSLRTRTKLGQQLLAEVIAFEPRITTCAYSEASAYNTSDGNARQVAIVAFGVSKPVPAKDRSRVRAWLLSRIEADSIVAVFD